MKAVLIATHKAPRMDRLAERYPAALLPLIDRPFIQHVVEYLAGRGFTRFEVVLGHLPEKIEALLKNGDRWGVDIRYHLVSTPDRPYRPLRLLERPTEDPWLLLVHADRLVPADIRGTRPARAHAGPVLYEAPETTEETQRNPLRWTGWAWLPANDLEGIRDDFDESAFLAFLEENFGSRIERVCATARLGMQSGADLLASHRRVMAQNGCELMLAGNEVEPGIWLSRNVSLHPTAELRTPVYIGENCRIARGARIGPGVAIGRNCVLGEKSTLEDTVVFPGSYVGDALELKDAIVDKNCLVNVRIGSEILIREDFILGSLEEMEFRRGWRRMFARAVACLLLVPAVPVVASAALYRRILYGGRAFTSKRVIRLPVESEPVQWKSFPLIGLRHDTGPSGKPEPPSEKAASEQLPPGWRHLIFAFSPALIHVARGELGFVGVPPRTAEEVMALPTDWRALYLKSKAGLVSECLVSFGVSATDDDRYAADAVYAVSTTVIYDLKLMLRYIGQVLGLLPLPQQSE